MQFTLNSTFNPKKVVRIHLIQGEVTEVLKNADGSRELHIAVGDSKTVTRRSYFKFLRRIVVEARLRKISEIAISAKDITFPRLRLLPRERFETLAAQFEIANYGFDIFKTDKKSKAHAVENVIILDVRGSAIQKALEAGATIGREVNAVRSLANTPAGSMTPATLADAAVTAARGTKVRVTVLEEAAMRKLKMGALLGVAQGSQERPRFIIMDYRGAAGKPIVLIGKGVTFDSGGINLKPSQAMDDMHMDMSGAAVVIHAVIAAAKLKVKKHVIALIPAVENMPSGSSYRPGDILYSMSGTTIEIGNTDAEGRVILSDALTYAERYKPNAVIDVATLTGAAMVALGQRASAVFSDNNKLVARAFEAAESSGDQIWQLPLWEEYDADIKGTFGDISNSGKSRYGGAITGARFLQHFAKKYPWMHIDMAPRMTSIEGDFLAKGSSGEPTQLLIRMLQKL